jgi:hypothetical protein
MDATYPRWVGLTAALVGRDRAAATVLAAEYLASLDGRMRIVPPPPLGVEQFDTSMRVTSVVSVKRSMVAGKTVEQAMADAFVLSVGAATRMVMNAGRQTVMQSAVASPQCEGWQRVTSGGCSFCIMLAGRGSVYSEATADFQSHDHCMCSAEPVFDR